MSDSTTTPLPSVVIVGRPNVGKSSLFNRIVGERRAIIEDEPGTTRDRMEAEVEWLGRSFRLIDTGGFQTDEEDIYASLIVGQIRTAIAQSSLVIFCVDSRDGLTASDLDVADVVRQSEKEILLVATKADNDARELTGIAEAGRLGFGTAMPLSALHDLNVGLMLDELIERIPAATATRDMDRTRIAIIGRPNVGKSTLVNALLGEERLIVSEVPGTTRDAIDTEVDTPEGKFTLIDTAGIRRPGKRGRGVERHSVMRATAAVERCDVAVLMVDGAEGITAQDAHIANIPVEASTGLVIAVNKTDLWEEERQERRLHARVRRTFRFVPYAMLGLISALEGKGINEILAMAAQAREARRRRIPTADLNALLRRAFREHVPPVVRNKRLRLRYATQAETEPPTFVLFVNEPSIVHFSYKRYLERTLRETCDFEGTAIRLIFRRSSEEEEEGVKPE